MPVTCPKCGEVFGDMQYRLTGEKYNFFDEKQTDHKCPKCGSVVIHNWVTMEDYLQEE